MPALRTINLRRIEIENRNILDGLRADLHEAMEEAGTNPYQLSKVTGKTPTAVYKNLETVGRIDVMRTLFKALGVDMEVTLKPTPGGD